MKRLRLLPSLLAVITLLFAVNPAVFADGPSTISLSPVKTSLKAMPGETKMATVTVSNAATSPITLTPSFYDFTSPDDNSGNPKILVDGRKDPHGLSAWASGATSVSVPAGGTTTYTLSIAVPAGTSAGSYYAAVQFANSSDATAPAIASLVFVDVGTVEQKIEIANLSLGETTAPTRTVTASIKDTGNGYVVPKVVVTLQDSNKKVLKTIDLNPKNGGILPGSTRNYTADLPAIDSAKDYTVSLKVTTDSGTVLTAQKTIKGVVPAATKAQKPASKEDGPNLLVTGVGALIVFIITAGLISMLMKFKKQPLDPNHITPMTPGQTVSPTSPEDESNDQPTPPTTPPTL
jgi:hypothetical protein